MNIFVLAYLGGIVGAMLMDFTETAAARIGITGGVNVALVGRWFLGLMRGRLAHAPYGLGVGAVIALGTRL